MDELELEIIDLYTGKGWSVTRLALKTGLAHQTIVNILKKAKVFKPGKNIDLRPRHDALTTVEGEVEKINERYQAGERLVDIAADYKVSRTTVYTALKMAGYRMKSKGGRRNKRDGTRGLDAAEFIEIWQSASSLDEFVDATGISHSTASARAGYYRTRKGIPLQSFKSREDWVSLAKFAKELREDSDAD